MSLEAQSPAVVYGGEDKTINIRLNDQGSGDPFDLTGATEILALFSNADGSALQKKMSMSQVTVLSAAAGRFSVALLAADTKLLAPGTQSIEIRVTKSSAVTIVQIPAAITMDPSLFPTV